MSPFIALNLSSFLDDTTYDFQNPNNALGSVYFNRPEIRKVAQSLSKTFRKQNDFKLKVDVTLTIFLIYCIDDS